MDMNIQKYIAFVKTVEYRSFTKAAEILSYTQSGISRMIHDLEKEWNIVLLERRKSGVELTSDGLKLFPYIKSLCSEYEIMQMQVDEVTGLQSGFIRIGTFSSVAAHWLPNIIKEFRKTYPNIEYELLLGNYNEIEEWIIEGRVDCGFVRLPTNIDLDVIPLEEDQLLAILPEGHALTDCDKFPLAGFCEEPFILLGRDHNEEILKNFEQYSLSPMIQYTTWDDYAIMSMVEKGLGISMLHEMILKRTPYHIVTRELDPPLHRNIGVALRNQKTASLAVKRFLEYLEYR